MVVYYVHWGVLPVLLILKFLVTYSQELGVHWPVSGKFLVTCNVISMGALLEVGFVLVWLQVSNGGSGTFGIIRTVNALYTVAHFPFTSCSLSG